MTVTVAVVGSVNLDLVASVSRLPEPGETVTGATFAQHPGGKGANQALAAQRLGASVTLIANVGQDANGDAALSLLRAGGVNLDLIQVDPDHPTGIAVIGVESSGENHIIVAPGANSRLLADAVPELPQQAVICELEIPISTVTAAAQRAQGLFCLNAAPAAPLPAELLAHTDLVIVNDTEHEALATDLAQFEGLLAVTHGADGATLLHAGTQVASAVPPHVDVVDAVGAGDTFVAALVVAILEDRPHQEALQWACTAAALATTRPGAQPSLPSRAQVDSLFGV